MWSYWLDWDPKLYSPWSFVAKSCGRSYADLYSWMGRCKPPEDMQLAYNLRWKAMQRVRLFVLQYGVKQEGSSFAFGNWFNDLICLLSFCYQLICYLISKYSASLLLICFQHSDLWWLVLKSCFWWYFSKSPGMFLKQLICICCLWTLFHCLLRKAFLYIKNH